MLAGRGSTSSGSTCSKGPPRPQESADEGRRDSYGDGASPGGCSRRSSAAKTLGLIRFRGHFPKGGYDVHDHGRDPQTEPATTPAVR